MGCITGFVKIKECLYLRQMRERITGPSKCRQNNEYSNLLIFIQSVVRASGELTGNLPNAPDIVDKKTISGISAYAVRGVCAVPNCVSIQTVRRSQLTAIHLNTYTKQRLFKQTLLPNIVSCLTGYSLKRQLPSAS